MAQRKRKNFAGYMVSYAICFLIVVCILMGVLWIYLAHYEGSQESVIIQSYISNISKDSLQSETKDLISSLDHTFQTEEEALDNLYDLIHNQTSYSKNAKDSTEDTIVFDLRVNKVVYGSLSLKKSNKKDLYGFEKWTLESDSLDYSLLVSEDIISIPSNWSITAKECVVTDPYITNYYKSYDLLNAFYGDWNEMGLPYLYEYRIGNKIGDIGIIVKDEAGNSYKTKDLKESLFLSDCDENTQVRIQNFMSVFLPGYIQCLSNANHDASGNFYALTPYLVPNGNLYTRIYNAIEGQTWANSNGDTIIDLQYNDYISVGNGCYVVDITYTLETIGLEGAVQSTHNARVLLVESWDSFLATDIETY